MRWLTPLLVSSCVQSCVGVARVGIMYEGWHAPAFNGIGTAKLTVEAVLESNGTRSMADMQAGMNMSAGMSFYYQKEPADGFYCIYRARPNSA